MIRKDTVITKPNMEKPLNTKSPSLYLFQFWTLYKGSYLWFCEICRCPWWTEIYLKLFVFCTHTSAIYICFFYWKYMYICITLFKKIYRGYIKVLMQIYFCTGRNIYGHCIVAICHYSFANCCNRILFYKYIIYLFYFILSNWYTMSFNKSFVYKMHILSCPHSCGKLNMAVHCLELQQDVEHLVSVKWLEDLIRVLHPLTTFPQLWHPLL